MSTTSAGLAAWLDAWARHGWRIDGATVAADAGLTPADLATDCADRFDALARAADALEHATLAAVPSAGSPRDRLFDALMAGFDWMQEHREAMLAVLDGRDPGAAALLGRRTLRALNRLLDAAGDATSGASRVGRLTALAAIHARALQAWRSDDSPDLSAVMRSLDSDLARAERAVTEGPLALISGGGQAPPPAGDLPAG
jgi:hypothetical protein